MSTPFIFVIALILGLGIGIGIILVLILEKKIFTNDKPVGNLKVCTGDPDGVYMFLESYVSPEYIMTQKTVTFSVDVTDVSQK